MCAVRVGGRHVNSSQKERTASRPTFPYMAQGCGVGENF
ncbi:unnamed protein product, partial [Staurois parvus]